MLPRSVARVGAHYSDLQSSLVDQALAALAPALRAGRRSPDSWRDAVASKGRRLLALQLAAASYADAYLNDVLDAQGADTEAEARVDPTGFVDQTDGGGSWLQALVFAPNSVRPKNGDWTRFDFVANSIVKTGLSDTARASVQAGMQARPAVRGYVRMLRGLSCSRCAVLAGRHYRSSVAFDRHKRCDCVHVPTSQDSGDWTTNPVTYFRSLSRDEQDSTFGKAAAEAIRLSGYSSKTMNQVVNAEQGVETVSGFGRELRITKTGTTRGTFQSVRVPRLMPDQIFQLAEEFNWDRAEVLRQLRRFGYVL